MSHVDGSVYAFRGENRDNFWRHNVGSDSWTTLTDTPESVEEGGSLVWTGGDFIYALRGDRADDFWRYTISTDSWENLEDAPENVDDGGALVLLNGFFYALIGDDRKDLWRFGPVAG